MGRKRKKKQEQIGWEGVILLILIVIIWNPVYEATGSAYMATAGVGVIGAVLLVIYIVILLMIQRKKNERLRKSGIREVDKMSGQEFEEYLAQLLKVQGYTVRTTSKSADYGADLLLQKEGKKIVIQAKRYKNTVGIKAVQEVIGAISHYKCTEGWVVTNSHFTPNAKSLATSNSIRLVEREELIRWGTNFTGNNEK